MPFFEPDRFFSRITAIDIQRDLVGRGLVNVLLDIDNTVRSRATGDIPHDVGVWMGRARDAGVRFCLLSNNWHDSVYAFAERCDLPIVAKSMKPLPHGYLLAMRKLGAARTSTVAIGDQVLTDVVGAHLVGVEAWLVLPLAEVDLTHTRVLRLFERGLIGAREPEPVGAGVPASVPLAMAGATVGSTMASAPASDAVDVMPVPAAPAVPMGPPSSRKEHA